MTIQEVLRQIPLFEPFSDNEIELIAEQCDVEEFSPGQYIIREGETDQDMYVIISGTVRITTESDHGEECLLGTLSSQAVFGEIAMLFGMPRSATVTATSNTECARISKEILLPMLTMRPQIGQELANIISARESSNYEVDALEDEEDLQFEIESFLESYE